MYQKSLYLIVFLFLGISFAFGQNIPQAKGFVNDTKNLFQDREEKRLEAYLEQFAKETSNEIAVGTFSLPFGQSVEEHAIQVAEAWKVGSKEHDNGVLVLIYPLERKVRIEVGYGLEGALTDITASRIIDQYMVPRFRKGDYFGGAFAAVEVIAGIVKNEYDIAQLHREYYDNTGDDLAWIIFIIILVILYAIIIYHSNKRGGRGGGYGRRGGGGWIYIDTFGGGSSGGFGGGSSGGSFGGFSGGSFGGGGATGGW